MRKLIIANTYYQLILAMQLNNTLFSEDDVVVLLSDHSKNTQKICKRLSELKIFSQTLFLKSKEITYNEKDNVVSRIRQIISIALNLKNEYSFYLNGIKDYYFDEVIFYNFETDIYALYSMLYEFNKDIKFSFYEEGLLSYDIEIKKRKKYRAINWIRRKLGKNIIFDSLKKFYCFYPENYAGKLNAVKVPPIEFGGKTSRQLLLVFDLEKENPYKTKYIFFTSVYDFEGGYIGEYDVVSKVCELVGKENVTVKIHPRDTRTIYSENGFCVDKNSEIPWEVIQLAYDFSGKIYLTATSGSVLAGSVLTENKVKTFYLYNLCDVDANEAAKKTCINIKNTIDNRRLKHLFNAIHIVENIDEIL